MTDPKVNSDRVLFPRGYGNIEGQGETKITISLEVWTTSGLVARDATERKRAKGGTTTSFVSRTTDYIKRKRDYA